MYGKTVLYNPKITCWARTPKPKTPTIEAIISFEHIEEEYESKPKVQSKTKKTV